MYRLSEIQTEWGKVVGWEQAYDPNKYISDDLIVSESGLTFQGAHPLVTLDNMAAIMPDDFDYQYPDWNMIVTYKVGRTVKHNNKVWIALQENVNTEPIGSDFNNDYSNDFGNPVWQEYNILNDFLQKLTNDGIKSAVQKFIEDKQLDNETKSLLEHRTFFDGSGRLAAAITNQSKICGYEITPVRSMGVTTKIERIGLQMTGATGTVRLYLFHSSQVDPIKTIDVEFTQTNGGFQWFTMTDLYLPYISDDNNAGGSWFLCYNQNDLPEGMQAINISKDWSREPCDTCNMGNVQHWRQLTKYLQIAPFRYQAPTTFEQYPELWDIGQTVWTNTVNYGINVEISVGCDLTDFMVSQRDMFKTIIQKQVAAHALRTLAMNPNVNVNRNQMNANRMDILYELDGNTNGVRPGGLGYELKQAYKAIKLDTQGLDRICLKCNNGGVKYRTV